MCSSDLGREYLHESIDMQMSLLENQIIRLRKKIELEQEAMGMALEGKK